MTWDFEEGLHYEVEDRGYGSPCWIWHKTKWKYPGSGEARPYRKAYEAFFGPIPQGKEIHHLCEQTHCINPEHLEAVTRAEHMQRRYDAKLDAEQVREIRDRLANGEGVRALGREFGVSHTTIKEIKLGRAWRNV